MVCQWHHIGAWCCDARVSWAHWSLERRFSSLYCPSDCISHKLWWRVQILLRYALLVWLRHRRPVQDAYRFDSQRFRSNYSHWIPGQMGTVGSKDLPWPSAASFTFQDAVSGWEGCCCLMSSEHWNRWNYCSSLMWGMLHLLRPYSIQKWEIIAVRTINYSVRKNGVKLSLQELPQ